MHFSFSAFLRVSHQFSLNSVCVSFSTFFSFLAIFQVLQSVFLNLHIFQCFLPISMTYSVSFSFSMFFSLINIFQVIECLCFNFNVFQFSCHNPCPRVCISHFSCFHYFSQYSRFYNESFSICTFLSVSRHIPGFTFFMFHLPRYSVFSPHSRS